MIKNIYGQTGIEVSAIGFGGMRFENHDDIDGSAELVKKAYELGVNYFDTAPGYSGDKSEIIFGTAIKELKKTRKEKPFYVSTKSGQVQPDKVRENLERSLERLNIDCIDFYHVWCVITRENFDMRKANGVLKEFEKIKNEGLAKNICVSTHLNGEEIAELLKEHRELFSGVLLGYSAMNFAYRDKGIQAANDLGMGVVVMNPLGGGIIPKNPDRFDFLKTGDESVVNAALRFLLGDDRITTSIVGFANEKDLIEAVDAAENFEPISADKINEIRASLKSAFDQMCTACQYCDHCPQGVPVPKLMDSYNAYMLADDENKDVAAINRLLWHWGIKAEDEYMRKCNQCGKCEELCTQQLPIIERLKNIRNMADDFLENKKQKQQ